MNKVSFIKALLEMDEASFTKKYNDDPKLKGGQKNLPDELQAQIVREDEVTSKIDASEKNFLQKIYKNTPIEKIPEKHRWAFDDKSIKKEDANKAERKFEVDDIVKVKTTGKKGKVVDMSPDETFFIVNIGGKNSSFYESNLELIKRRSINETEDREVDWPKEIPSKYADEFLFIYDESKPGFYNVQDVATGKMVGRVGFNTPEKAIEFAQDKIKPKGGTQSTQFESEDHEVSMAQNSLKSIISSASQLMNSLGQDEKDIPAWIQDHITNAENYINQASKNYHEYNEGATSEYDMDELPDGTEEKLAGDAEDVQMKLKSMMENLFERKKAK
jgi:hypothetical protein